MMAAGALDGWTPDKLDAMRSDVNDIKETLAKIQSDETQSLRNRVKELEARPLKWLFALGGPIVAAAVAVLLTHALS